MQNNSYLANLAPELLAYILSFISEKELKKSIASLTGSCMLFYGIFQFENLSSVLLHAVIDDDRKAVKQILDANPEILLRSPPANLVIESKFTWQKYFAESPLKIAATRKQLEMVRILLPYYTDLASSNKLEQYLIDDALSFWKLYEIHKNADGFEKIIIPKEYSYLANSLVEIFKNETFPNGVPGVRKVPMNVYLSEDTESALSFLLNILAPKNPVKLSNYIDVELFLLATFKSYVDNYNSLIYWDQKGQFCVLVIGLIQSALSPETGKIWCQGIYDVVEAINKGNEIELDHNAQNCNLKNGGPMYCSSSFGRRRWGTEHYVNDDGYGLGGGSWDEWDGRVVGFGPIAFAYWRDYLIQKQQVFGNYANNSDAENPTLSRI